MKITVESGDGFSFHMQARPDDLVAGVKWNIQKKCGQTLYRVQDQMLKYGGKVLKDDTTLKDNNIHDNCSIFLTRVLPARPSRVSSTTTSTTTVVPSSNSVPPSSTNPDSTPSPLTTVTADVANLPAGSSFDLTIQSFGSDIREGALRRIDVDHSSCDAFENTIKRALRYQATAVPAHARDSPVASQLAQLAAVQASQHTQTAGEASQPTPLAPEGIPTRERVLAQIAAAQASQLAQAAAEASQPATPAHKYKGTPARARLLTHVAAVQASQRKQTAAQASQPAPPAPKGITTRERVLAKITAAQASLLAQAAAEASQPATPAYKGTPARVRCLAHLAAVHASQRKQTSAQASQPAPPAPKVSEPNATPLNPFQAIDYRRLDRVKDNPQLRALRALVQVNPHILEPMLEELGYLGRQNPDVRQCIQDNQAEFMQDMLQPPQRPVRNLSNQSADAIPQEMTFTLEEREAIDRLEAMGFDRKMVVQVFITCNKDEELAANSLLGNHD